MEPVLAALKNTPIPTILVVAGIAFLLLSIAGQLAGRITVPPERQRQATIIGAGLLAIGLALHLVPLLQSDVTPPAGPSDQASGPSPPHRPEPPPTPQPPPPDISAVPLPSLNAGLTALRFFEHSPCSKLPSVEERTYQQRFPQVMTREIYTELTLAHPKQERRLKLTIQGFYRHKGHVINKPDVETEIPANREESVYSFNRHTGEGRAVSCVGGYPRGRWSAGLYSVDVYLNGEQAASGSFEISEWAASDSTLLSYYRARDH